MSGARFHHSPPLYAGRMPAALSVCSAPNTGLPLRDLGCLALEDQSFAHRDRHSSNESDPSIAFHACLCACRLLPSTEETLSMPRSAGTTSAGVRISKEMFLGHGTARSLGPPGLSVPSSRSFSTGSPCSAAMSISMRLRTLSGKLGSARSLLVGRMSVGAAVDARGSVGASRRCAPSVSPKPVPIRRSRRIPIGRYFAFQLAGTMTFN